MMDMEPELLSHYFPEMRDLLTHCRFNNCVHVEEPGCAVKKAVEESKISAERYINKKSIGELKQAIHGLAALLDFGPRGIQQMIAQPVDARHERKRVRGAVRDVMQVFQVAHDQAEPVIAAPSRWTRVTYCAGGVVPRR